MSLSPLPSVIRSPGMKQQQSTEPEIDTGALFALQLRRTSLSFDFKVNYFIANQKKSIHIGSGAKVIYNADHREVLHYIKFTKEKTDFK